MRFDQLQGCCSIYILSDFGSAAASRYDISHHPDEVDEWLSKCISKLQKASAYFIVALDQHQLEKFKDVFIKNGFEIYDTQLSHNHGNYTTLLIRKNNNTEQTKETVAQCSITEGDLPF